MYTRCPHCQTCFRIAEAHLKAANGRVRCGSCKEVFNANSHIYDNLPDAEKNEIKNNPVFPKDEHQHIDLSSPPDRSNAPDQSKFMESIIGENSRYNNLDNMGTIDIPGDTDFTESFIKFVETEYDPEKKISAHPISDPVFGQSDKTTTDKSKSDIKSEKPSASLKQSQINFSPSNESDSEIFSAESKDNLSANPFIAAFTQQQAYQTTKSTENKPTPEAKLQTEIKPDTSNTFESETKSDTFSSPSKSIQQDDSVLPPLFTQNESKKHTGDFEISPNIADKTESIPQKRNKYEDLESLTTATTNTEIEGIDDLYSAAQLQLEEPGSDPEKLNQDIEALLDDAMSQDDQKAQAATNDENSEPEMANNEFNIKAPENDDLSTSLLGDINFLDDSPDEPNEVLTQFEQELQKIEFSKADAASFSLDNDDALENLSRNTAPLKNELDIADEPESSENIVIGSAEPTAVPGPSIAQKRDRDDELPSAEHELPKALRSSFAHLDRPERPIELSIVMGAGIFALLLVMLSQMVVFRSYQLANQFPALAPVLSSMCESIPCRYSGSIDVTQIELMNRNVRSHPSQKNALLISTAFKNNADFNQPYPTIAIRLSDLSGHVVATRYFTPEEYLENFYNKFLLMESGTPVHVTLAVLDPGDDAINFEFSFLWPDLLSIFSTQSQNEYISTFNHNEWTGMIGSQF